MKKKKGSVQFPGKERKRMGKEEKPTTVPAKSRARKGGGRRNSWGAQKVPPYNRVKKGIFPRKEGRTRQCDEGEELKGGWTSIILLPIERKRKI